MVRVEVKPALLSRFLDLDSFVHPHTGACQAYVERLGELSGAPVDVVSVDPDRQHTLVRRGVI